MEIGFYSKKYGYQILSSGGESDHTVDSFLSEYSKNPVENRVIYEALMEKADGLDWNPDTGVLYLLCGDEILSQVELGATGTGSSGIGDPDVGLTDVLNAKVNGFSTTAELTWEDPQDAVFDDTGQVLAEWAFTRLVRKEGTTPPISPTDGRIVIDLCRDHSSNGGRNRYRINPYVDEGLTYNQNYYYRWFVYTKANKITYGTALPWTPQRLTVEVPSLKNELTYTGSLQTPTWNDYNSSIMTKSGDLSGTGAGTYTTIFALAEGYCWPDGTTDPKSVQWSISKAPLTLRVSPNPVVLYGTEEVAVTVNYTEGARIQAVNNNSSFIDMTYEVDSTSQATVYITGKDLEGSGTVNIICTKDNYSTSVEVLHVTTNFLKMVRFDDDSEDIKYVSMMIDAYYNGSIGLDDIFGNGADKEAYWSVGQRRRFKVSETGSYTRYVVLTIIDYDHDLLATPYGNAHRERALITLQHNMSVVNGNNQAPLVSFNSTLGICKSNKKTSLWDECYLKEYLNTTWETSYSKSYLAILDKCIDKSLWENSMKSVVKTTHRATIDNTSETDQTFNSIELIFIPSKSEIFSSNELSSIDSSFSTDKADGSQYRFYRDYQKGAGENGVIKFSGYVRSGHVPFRSSRINGTTAEYCSMNVYDGNFEFVNPVYNSSSNIFYFLPTFCL